MLRRTKLILLKLIQSFAKNAKEQSSSKYSTSEKSQGLLRGQVSRPTYQSQYSPAKPADISTTNSNQEKESDWIKMRRTYSGIHTYYMELQEDLEQEKET